MSEMLGAQLEEAIKNCQAISQECRDTIASRDQLMETRFQHWKRRLAGLVSSNTLSMEWKQKMDELTAENALLKQRLVDVGRMFGVSSSSAESVVYPAIIHKKHQDQVDALRKELQDKSNKAIDDLQSAITDLKASFQTLCKENESLKLQLASAKAQAASATVTTVAKADDALITSKRKLAAAEGARAAADLTIKRLEQQLGENKKLIESLTTTQDAVQTVKIALTGLDALRASYTKSATAYSELKRTWPNAAKAMDHLKTSVKEVSDDHSSAKQQIQELQRLVSTNKNKVDNLIEQAKPAIAAFQEAAREQERELQSLSDKNKRLELQNASLQKKMAEQETAKHDKESTKAKKDTPSGYQGLQNDAQNQPSEAEAALAALHEAQWDLRKELTREHQTKEFYLCLCEKHEEKIRFMRDEIKALKMELASSANTTKQLQKSNDAKRTKLIQLQTQQQRQPESNKKRKFLDNRDPRQ